MGGATGTHNSSLITEVRQSSMENGMFNLTLCEDIYPITPYIWCRYEIAGQEMPLMRAWMEMKVGLDLSLTSFSQVSILSLWLS